MYHLIDARAIEPQIRRRICERCWRRPLNSETLSPATPRSCESTCPVFQMLPYLVRRAELVDPSIASIEQVLRQCIADYCNDTKCDVEVLQHYGSGLAHIIADMGETGG
jgi:hypothetical protein